jgi:type II secretory pathway pseudopilin PulG
VSFDSINSAADFKQMKAPLAQKGPRIAAGVSVFELLIVVTMISVLTGFALLQITRARQVMTRANAARQLSAFLEKARVDSVRRRPTANAQMAQVSLLDATSYSVEIDLNGDRTLDAPQVIRLPADANLQFDLPYPRTIYFNWRGRTVDAAGNIANPSFVNIFSPNYGSTRIDLTSAGQPTFDGPPPSSAVINSAAPTPSFRDKTQVP